MKQWIVRAMLLAFGIWLGAVLVPEDWRAGMRRQTFEVTAGARERAALWAASQSDRLDARASLFGVPRHRACYSARRRFWWELLTGHCH